jgi:hypothetical protein
MMKDCGRSILEKSAALCRLHYQCHLIQGNALVEDVHICRTAQ